MQRVMAQLHAKRAIKGLSWRGRREVSRVTLSPMRRGRGGGLRHLKGQVVYARAEGRGEQK